MNIQILRDFFWNKIYYFCDGSNYKKYGYWRFEGDGKLSGLGLDRNTQYWKFNGNQLEILDGQMKNSSVYTYQTINGIGMFSGYSTLPGQENFKLLLILTRLTEIETLNSNIPNSNDFLEAFKYYGSESRKNLMNLVNDDKTIDGFIEGKFVVIPRQELSIGLLRYKGIHYTVEVSKENVPFLSKKLLVFFPGLNAHNHAWARENFYPVDFGSLAGSIAKNTMILRIAESNLISGSFWQNTSNFPDYEERVQELIQFVAQREGIPKPNIFLYGMSRGATGALLHGLLGNYSLLAVDPIINTEPWTEDADNWLLLDQIPRSLLNRVSSLMATNHLQKSQISILGHQGIPITYTTLRQLDPNKFQLLELNMKFSKNLDNKMKHLEFVGKTIPLHLSLINNFLYSVDLNIR